MKFKLSDKVINLGMLLLFLSITVPTTYIFIKIIILSIVFSVSIFSIINRGKLIIDRKIFLGILIVIITSFYFIVQGYYLNAPGAIKSIGVFVLWPIIYTVLILQFNRDIIRKINKVFIYSTLFISIYSFIYIANGLNLIPSFLYIEIDVGQKIGFHEGFIEYYFHSVASFIFLLPYLTSIVSFWKPVDYLDYKITKKLVLFTLLIGYISAFLSGRRALWLVIFLSIVINMTLLWIINRKSIHKSILNMVKIVFIGVFIFLCIIPILNKYIDINIISMIKTLDFSSENERISQFYALISDWKKRPFLGNGIGASTYVIRSKTQPWAYELTYIDLLFKTGIIGVTVYLVAILSLIKKMILMAKENREIIVIILPLLVGLISFLIANATNPYLLKFDYLWVLFVPIGVLNFYKTRRNIVN